MISGNTDDDAVDRGKDSSAAINVQGRSGMKRPRNDNTDSNISQEKNPLASKKIMTEKRLSRERNDTADQGGGGLPAALDAPGPSTWKSDDFYETKQRLGHNTDNGNEKTDTEYTQGSGVSNTFHGPVYQIKHYMLIIERAFRLDYCFKLAKEMKGAGKFDDLVFIYWKNGSDEFKCKFAQFKHKAPETGNLRPITAGQLLSESDEDFSLFLYFKSVCTIETKGHEDYPNSGSKDYTLCTNRPEDAKNPRSNGKICVKEEDGRDNLLEITHTSSKAGPRRYKLERVGDPKLCKLLSQHCSTVGGNKNLITNFFNSFIIAVNQPNAQELTEELSKKLTDRYKLADVELLMGYFEARILEWFKKAGPKCKYFTEKAAAQIFDGIQNRVSTIKSVGPTLKYVAKLKNYKIKFESANEKIQSFLSTNSESQKPLELSSSTETLLLALMVWYQMIKADEGFEKDDSYIWIEVEDLKHGNEFVSHAFRWPEGPRLLVVDCGSDRDKIFAQKLLNSLIESVNGKNKKLIIISQTTGVSTVSDNAISFRSLNSESQRIVLEKPIKFQGSDGLTNLSKLLGIRDSNNLNEEELNDLSKIINCDALVKLIRAEEEDPVPVGSKDIEWGATDDHYLPRKCISRETSELSIPTDLPEELLDLRNEDHRTVIIRGVAGIGKSMLLTHLIRNIEKNCNFPAFIVRVNLRQFTDVFRKRVESSSTPLRKFLVDDSSGLSTDFERRVLDTMIENQKNVVLMFDGLDQIESEYRNSVIELIEELRELRVRRIFVTTSPERVETLERDLETYSYELQPFDPETQIACCHKFWGRESVAGEPNKVLLNLSELERNVTGLLEKYVDNGMAEFLGIPLHTRLVAEFIALGNNDVTELCNHIIDRKQQIFFDQPNKCPSRIELREFRKAHQELALEELFPEDFRFQEDSDMEDVAFYAKAGIFTLIEDKVRFNHKIYAEYFVADFIFNVTTDKSRRENEKLKKIFQRQLLVKTEYTTVRIFLNGLLNEPSSNRNPSAMELWKLNSIINYDNDGANAYDVATKEELYKMLELMEPGRR